MADSTKKTEQFRDWFERNARDLLCALRDVLYAFGRAVKEIILDPREGSKNRTTYILCGILALIAVIYLCRHPENWEPAAAAMAAAGGLARTRAAVSRYGDPYGQPYAPPMPGIDPYTPEFPDGIPGEQEWPQP